MPCDDDVAVGACCDLRRRPYFLLTLSFDFERTDDGPRRKAHVYAPIANHLGIALATPSGTYLQVDAPPLKRAA